MQEQVQQNPPAGDIQQPGKSTAGRCTAGDRGQVPRKISLLKIKQSELSRHRQKNRSDNVCSCMTKTFVGTGSPGAGGKGQSCTVEELSKKGSAGCGPPGQIHRSCRCAKCTKGWRRWLITTGFGVTADKVIKNVFASKGVYDYIKDMKQSENCPGITRRNLGHWQFR